MYWYSIVLVLEIGFVCGIEVTRTWNRIVAIVLGGMLSIGIPLSGLSFGRALPFAITLFSIKLVFAGMISVTIIFSTCIFPLFVMEIV
ncbi:putative membrane protein [Bacillus cereus]|nr:putative membrane protein [Bacillus cereus]